MQAVPLYMIDFDSTLVGAETLDVLAEVALAAAPDREHRVGAVRALTEAAMAGRLPFGEALRRRLALLDARREHLAEVIQRLRSALTPSAVRNRAFLTRADVFVVSGGFEELIAPVLARLGVTPDRIRANRFLFTPDGRVMGCDPASPLAHDGGKTATARTLVGETGRPLVMVGDGWTDLEVWSAGAAARFYAYTEVVARPAVLARAERRADSLEDLLRQEGMAR